MPAPNTTQELIELVKKSELIPLPKLDAFFTQVKAASSAATPRDLANLLVAAGLLTQFQSDQFMQGKWRGFNIGKYRVLERIGSGGMGTVYLCEHVMVGRKVAVKVLPTSQAANPSALGRFYREARAAGLLDHPNLVKAHDVDEDGGLHYLVMDYVDGSSLQDVVAKHGVMSVTRACHYVRLAARGLQAAHQAGVLHRDVKPANVLLERNGNVRVLDLGLARFYNDNADLLTLKYDDQNVLGTADYVSPEQALNSHEVDVRTDVYSLGATFYFCLTGKPPFPDGKIAQKLIWHQVRQPTPVRQLRPDVPEAVAAIVAKMMEKDPARRFQSPAEVIDALAPLTREKIAPPRADEMPKLSPAASAPVPGNGAAAVVSPREVRHLPATQPQPRGAGTAVAAGLSNRTVALGNTPGPSGSQVATPRSTPAKTPTRNEPRPAPIVSPSQLIEQAAREAAPKTPWGDVVMRFLLVTVAGGAAGAAVWWVLGR